MCSRNFVDLSYYTKYGLMNSLLHPEAEKGSEYGEGKRKREGERERGSQGERKRGREGVRERGIKGERERGRAGERVMRQEKSVSTG